MYTRAYSLAALPINSNDATLDTLIYSAYTTAFLPLYTAFSPRIRENTGIIFSPRSFASIGFAS